MTDDEIPVESAAPAPAPEPLLLGTVALRLGIATISCGGLAGAAWIVPGVITLLGWIAVLAGIASIVVGIVAIVKRRARKHAVIGMLLTVATLPVAFLLAFVATMIMLMIGFGFSG
jgi:hypothetical protein